MIDHLVLAVPDLAGAIRLITEEWGIVPSAGGLHPRHGTHNALLRLGSRQYLEILAADPQVAPSTRSPRGRAIAAVRQPVLWEAILALPDGAAGLLARLPAECVVVADSEGSRIRDDGEKVSWRLIGIEDRSAGRFPDAIEWLTPHPAAGLPNGGTLERACISLGNGGSSRNFTQLFGEAVGIICEPYPTIEAEILTPRGLKLLQSSDKTGY